MSPSISYEPFVLLLGICLKSCDKVAKHQTGINLCVYTNYSATWVRLIQAVVIDDRTWGRMPERTAWVGLETTLQRS